MTEALKPCPFCGGEAVVKTGHIYMDTAYRVECAKCHAITNRFVVDHPKYNSYGVIENTRYTDEQAKNKAIEAWNRRAE